MDKIGKIGKTQTFGFGGFGSFTGTLRFAYLAYLIGISIPIKISYTGITNGSSCW
jgi:hypothetical protein